MAITTEVRGDILELLVLMFDAAPGANYLTEITTIYESIPGTHDQKMAQLAQALSTTGAFQTLHPNFQSGPAGQPSAEFATDFLSTVGLEDNAEARKFVADNYGNGSYAAKAQIMYIAWDFLNEYSGENPDFLMAKEILMNKAEVSEHFSVTLGANGSGSTLEELIASLQDVVANVDETQESVDAAIDAIDDENAVGPELTPANDVIDVLGTTPTNISGIVDFNSDGDPNGTFNPGDNITGNGNTNLNLVVVDSGDNGFSRLENIEAVNIEAGTNGWVDFNAGGWEGVGSVNLNSGVDGLWVSLDNLNGGTEISVSDVQGGIGAGYDTDGGDLYMSLVNRDEGSEGISGVATVDGVVTITGADSVSAYMWDDGGVELSSVNATMGDMSLLEMEFTGDAPSLGDITVTLGEGGTFDPLWGGEDEQAGFTLAIHDTDGDVTVGDVMATAGGTSDLEVIFGEDISDGDVTVGNVSLTAGDFSQVDVYVSEVWDGDVTFGDITTTAGVGGDSDVTFYGEDTALVAGNITMTVGAEGGEDDDDADAYASLEANSWSSVDFGDVSLSGGDGANLWVTMAWNGAVDVGAMDLVTGDDAYAQVLVRETEGDTVVTSINVEGGDGSSGRVYFNNSGDSYGSDLTVGDVSVMMGASGYAWFTVEDHLNTTIGNVALAAGADTGEDNDIYFYVEGEGEFVGFTTTEDGEDGDGIIGMSSSITIGNITADVTADEAGGSVWVSIDNQADDSDEYNAGNVTVGNVDISAAGDDSEAYFFVWNSASSETTTDNEGTAVGDITVGNVSVEAGAQTDLESSAVAVAVIVNDADGYSAGDVMVGDMTITVGAGFASGTETNEAQGVAIVANLGEDAVGDVSVGDVMMTAGDFASLTFAAVGAGSASFGEDFSWVSPNTSVGNVTVGDVEMDAGESASIKAYVYQYGEESLGSVSIGNVDINAAQDSMVDVSFSAWAQDALDAGDFTAGNVMVTMGDNATAYVDVHQWVNYAGTDDDDLMGGDFTVGDVSVAVSATETEDLSGGSYIQAYISSSQQDMTGFDAGSFTVGDVSLSAEGDDAVFDLYIAQYVDADSQGDMTVGTVSITGGDGASISEYATIEIENGAGDTGNLSIEGISIDVGDSSDISFEVLVDAQDDAGAVGLGNLTANAGEGSSIAINLVLSIDSAADLDSLSIGNINVDAGDESSVKFTQFDYAGSGDVGDITVGDMDASFGDTATMSFSVSISADSIGEVNVGNVAIDGGDDSTAYWGLILTGAGIDGVTVGAFDVSVSDGGTAAITIDASAEDNTGPIVVGDVTLTAAGTLTDTEDEDSDVVSGNITMLISHDGGEDDTITVGDVTIDVQGTGTDDYVRVDIISNDSADVVIGDITVSGDGWFFIDGETHTGDNESYLNVDTSGSITIGDVDFSGYSHDILLDLGWTTSGAANISAGSGDDTIVGNSGNNIISGGEGVDEIDLDDGGDDTLVFNEGDSGVTKATADVVTGFDGDDTPVGAADGDKLDFNLVAGTAGNFVAEGDDTFDDDTDEFEDIFIAMANDTLNSTVKYFAMMDTDGDTWVAVNYGSGEADLVVELVGMDVDQLSFGNFKA